MTVPDDLASLLASGEQAAFHGRPGEAVGVLERAVVLARSQGRTAEMATAGWLLGVVLGAGGRYGGALTVLSPLLQAGRADGASAQSRRLAALAAATVASVHRQLGRHTVARACDQEALELADGAGEAAFDAQLGLASDAVGLGEPDEAATRLSLADALVPPGGEQWWRQRVRLGWVTAEAQLLDGRVDEAAGTALAAVDRAERAHAPRHVAKGLLILGIAQVSGGESAGDRPVGDAATTLQQAATLAESLGTVPLIWPARALLGALVADDDPAQSARSLAAARAAVLTLAADLPPGVRSEWLARPDVAALLES